jgi:hypothetical protein
VRSFSASGYRLSEARLEVRLVYSGFLAVTLIGLLTLAILQLGQIGPTPERIAAYYRGGTRGGEMTFPKTFRELVELTHFHAFVMAILYLVLAHLLLATRASERSKRIVIAVSFAGLVGDVGAVWLIRYISAAFAYAQVVCWGAQWVGYVAFVYYPLREMWFEHGREALPPE